MVGVAEVCCVINPFGEDFWYRIDTADHWAKFGFTKFVDFIYPIELWNAGMVKSLNGPSKVCLFCSAGNLIPNSAAVISSLWVGSDRTCQMYCVRSATHGPRFLSEGYTMRSCRVASLLKDFRCDGLKLNRLRFENFSAFSKSAVWKEKRAFSKAGDAAGGPSLN